MKILISAAETSSDAHGAQLLRALRAELGPAEKLDAFGIGGPELQREGLRAVVDARELLSMGFTEVLARLPGILRGLKAIAAASRKEKPDLAVVIDYPDFHFRLARRLKAQGIPVVYYIPPKLWVWRQGRIRTLRRLFDLILCILPFEEKFYRDRQVSAKYVGNPLSDELPLKVTREEARSQLGIGAREKTLLLMPGSRPAELSQHLELFLDAADDCAKRLGTSLRALVPLASTSDLPAIRSRIDRWLTAGARSVSVDIREGQSHLCMLAADAGLVKSGTSTLEAALLLCPHVIVYKPSAFSQWLYRNVVRYRGPVGLVNLVGGGAEGGPSLVREILCEEVSREALTEAAYRLLTEDAERERLVAGFRAIREKLVRSESPSIYAAREVLAIARARGSK